MSAPLASALAEHQAYLYKVCLNLMRDEDEALDAVQETMLRALRFLGAFDGRASLRTWMHRIAVNVCLGRFRKLKLRACESLDAPVRPDESEGESLGDLLCAEDARQASTPSRVDLEALLARMPLSMRTVLELRYVQGYSTEEVAEMQGRSVQGLKSQLTRGRAWLAERLGEGPIIEPGASELDSVIEGLETYL